MEKMINSEKTLLNVKDLYVEYMAGTSTVHAVNGVSFALQQGMTLGFVGETGAGKTSIAKAILSVLPDPPARVPKGEIWFGEKNILQSGENELREIRGNQISMIFQDPMTALNPVMSIGRQIAEVVRLHNDVTALEAEKRALEMLKMVGITEERYDEYPFQLSGGMKQRVVIAIALACQPKLLLADEPTTALDVTIQAQILDMINDLKKKLDTALILITHDLGIVAQMCDYVAVVYAGQIVESGSLEDIFDHPSHPYTVGLFQSLPSFATDARRLHVIEGLPPDPCNLPEGCSFHPRCKFATEECKQCAIDNREITPGHMCRCIHTQMGEG